jgi:hypothetical protein
MLYPDILMHSPFLLSGLARCAYCGSAMCGSYDNVKTRPDVWAYYLCGRKVRQGWHTCEGRKIKARSAEQAVLRAVQDRVLTSAFVEELVEEVNVYLGRDLAGLDRRIEETRKRLAEEEARHRQPARPG